MSNDDRIPARDVEPKGFFAKTMMKLYVPSVLQGMKKTLEYMVRPKATLQYPEVKRKTRKGYRGEHRLKKDDQGRPKCVACFMCATACPAECITIVAGEAPWPDRDKYPVKFEIDVLRCCFCGMCEEACPKDAIKLSTIYEMSIDTRPVYDKDYLLEQRGNK